MGGPTFNWTGFGFHEGKGATKWTGYWDLPWAYRAFKFDWDVAHVPAGPAGRTTTLGSNWYGVSAISKHPAEAMDFVKYLESEGLAMYASLGGALPARLSLLLSDSFLQPGKRPLHRRVFVEAIPTAKWPPLTPHWNSLVNEILDPELAKAFRGEVSLDQAIRVIMDKAQAILK
ncbi:MAG: extracellular solute-binding protein [Limnochordales bacterium]|nr:extracellular solute-binding protein [Limnochordales bacterium]